MNYFGQTVNIAARVQSLACGGEICLAENILETEIVKILNEKKKKNKRRKTALKGIRNKTIVHHYAIA